MLLSLTDAALLLPLQTTLDVCHVCKKITERVSDKTRAYLLLLSHFCLSSQTISHPPEKCWRVRDGLA